MNENKLSQQQRILSYIAENGSITSHDAQFELGISDPRKRISELRRKGYIITDEWENGKNRYGEKCRYKRYYLAG